MVITDFTEVKTNGCNCWVSGGFLIVKQKDADIYNAYLNGSSVHKEILRQDTDKDGNPVDVLGAKEYATAEEAALDCI